MITILKHLIRKIGLLDVILITFILIIALSGCAERKQSIPTKETEITETHKPSYEDRGENIFYIPYTQEDIMIDSLKLLRKEHPDLDIMGVVEATEKKGTITRVTGYIIIGEKVDSK